MTWMKDRPDWWPAWTNYPHGSLSESRARELSRHCVKLEETLLSAEAAQREARNAALEECKRVVFGHYGGPGAPISSVAARQIGGEIEALKTVEPQGNPWRNYMRGEGKKEYEMQGLTKPVSDDEPA